MSRLSGGLLNLEGSALMLLLYNCVRSEQLQQESHWVTQLHPCAPPNPPADASQAGERGRQAAWLLSDQGSKLKAQIHP